MTTYVLTELADMLGATLSGNASIVVNGVAPLDSAGPDQLSFLADPKYAKHLPQTKAGVVLLSSEYAEQCPVNALIIENPAAKFAQIAALFARKVTQATGIHPSAVVDKTVQLDETISIGAHCVIESGVKLGKHTVIMPNTVIGADVVMGDSCVVYPNVTCYSRSVIGSNVIIHSGAVIGSDGFGNAQENGRWMKVPQLGRVLIGNDVEIGANTTIDCGALGDTIIEEGVKLDNLIQIAHNVHIGAHTAIAAQTGIAGSTKIGKHCMIAGKAAINGHITICDQVILTAMTAVAKSITQPGVYSSGITALKNRHWNKSMARFKQLDEIYKRLAVLEKEVEKI